MAKVVRPILAIRLSASDNVATLLTAAHTGDEIAVRDASTGAIRDLSLRAATNFRPGHKIAIERIPTGTEIRKYGLPIGRATVDIASGEHVHVHNIRSNVGSHSTVVTPGDGTRRIPAEDLRRIIEDCVRTAGASSRAAAHMAEALVEAHLRGVETHGVRRLAPYVERLRAGGVDGHADPEIDTREGVLRVDGRAGIGHHVATVAADAVADAAQACGVAVALVRNSNHFGFAGYYASRIAARGMAAMVTSNGQVLVGPDGARQALFSNDPVAIAAPLPGGMFFEFDMATSVTSRARIVQAAEQGRPIPKGHALDAEGNPTTDAALAAEGILLPFGGDKGFGFIAAIEMLTGILSGGAYADQVASKEADPSVPEGTAHFLMAIDSERACGREALEKRLADMSARIANLSMREGSVAPRHPGKRRWELRVRRLKEGIPVTESEYALLRDLAASSGSEAPR